jgi:putative transposase
MEHTRGAPYHPMTQGKIERWHQTLKNRILLENYYLPGDLEGQIAAFAAARSIGKIDKLTFDLGPMQLSDEDENKMRDAISRGKD